MAPNERARKNHDELFPGHVSTLAAAAVTLSLIVLGVISLGLIRILAVT